MAFDSSSDIVNTFLKEYPIQQRYWKDLAGTTHDICQRSLNIQGIGAVTTFREKSHDSSKEKVERFSVRRGGYKTKEEIYDDIPDFAGVRIALFIPSQKDIVGNIINESFEKVKVVNHPGENDKQRGRAATGSLQREYKSVFSGYSATHYHVQLRKADVAKYAINYIPGHVIEIQVVSAFHNAWAEVEHDIRYKALAGSPSQEEHVILDCLRGLVQSGDLLLNQLHDKYMSRKTAANDGFTNEFALATFLFGWISRTPDKRDVNIGPVEPLLKLLKIFKLNNPVDLQVELENMDFRKGSNPQTKSTEERFQPFELGVSIHIMDHILLTKGESISAASAAKEAKERYGEYGYKIRVMMSVIMWLDEFFLPVLRWEEKFSNHSRNHEQEESLSWFIRTVRLTKILRDGANPSPKEETMLNDLWGWFEGHGEEVVQFVLKLAKMGILKDPPNEMFQFKRVCSSVKFLFSCQGL
jgi:ppGpp synthetase/RelA/SpoT-type nucleotidyltranferase